MSDTNAVAPTIAEALEALELLARVWTCEWERDCVDTIRAALTAAAAEAEAPRWIPCSEPPNHSMTVVLRYGNGNQAVTGFYSPGDGRWMRFKSAGLCEPLPAFAESSWYLELPELPAPPKGSTP